MEKPCGGQARPCGCLRDWLEASKTVWRNHVGGRRDRVDACVIGWRRARPCGGVVTVFIGPKPRTGTGDDRLGRSCADRLGSDADRLEHFCPVFVQIAQMGLILPRLGLSLPRIPPPTPVFHPAVTICSSLSSHKSGQKNYSCFKPPCSNMSVS